MATDPDSSLVRINPQALIEKALDHNVGIETMERLLGLAERVQQLHAREAWFRAMARFQAECPPIYKDHTARIAGRTGGGYQYQYAALDTIKPAIDPILAKHGLTARWNTGEIASTQVTVECLVSHELGHTESSGKVTMPVLGGPEGVGANPAQRVAIAMTYAKRYSLLNALGLAPEADSDGAEETARSEAPATSAPPPMRDATQGPVVSFEEEERNTLIAEATRLAKILKLTTQEKNAFKQEFLGGVEVFDADLSALAGMVAELKKRERK